MARPTFNDSTFPNKYYYRAPEKMKIKLQFLIFFCYFCSKTYLVCTHWNCLTEAIPICTHKISMAQRKTRLSPYFSKISFITNSEQMSHSL